MPIARTHDYSPAKNGLATAENAATASALLEFEATADIYALEKDWRRLEAAGRTTAYQSFDWVSGWLETVAPSKDIEPFIVSGRIGNRIAIILPFAVHKGILRTARGAGEPLAPLWMPVFDPDFSAHLTPEILKKGIARAADERGGIDRISLKHALLSWNGADMPVLSKSSIDSANQVFCGDISDGYEAIISQPRMKRYRKKMRWQVKQFDQHGEWSADRVTGGDTREAMNAFFAQKAARLKEMGASDCFCAEPIQRFFRRQAENGDLLVFTLQVAGKIRAVAAGYRRDGHFSFNVISFANDEIAQLSPGEYLLHQVIRQLSEDGVQTIDFGPGEARYKGVWCQRRDPLYDLYIPVSLVGYLVAAAGYVKAYLKRTIKNNARLWEAFSSARRMISGTAKKPDGS